MNVGGKQLSHLSALCAELGLGIVGFALDSSPISLVQCAVAAKNSLQNIGHHQEGH